MTTHEPRCAQISLLTGQAETPPPATDALWALGLSVLVFLLAHGGRLFNPFAINDDVRQQLYWMQRWLDPQLYPPSLLNGYAQAYVSPGVKALYGFASPFIGPLAFSKVLSGLLFVAQCLLVRGVGLRLGGRAVSWACMAMVWLMPFFIDNISGGLARAFASPLLALFVLLFLSGGWAMFAVLLQGLFIPYIGLPCFLAGGLCDAAKLFKGRLKPTPLWVLGWISALGGVAAAWWANAHVQELGFGPLVSLAETVGRPEFGPKGRLEIAPLPNPFLDFVYYPFEGVGLFKEFGLAAGIVTLVLLAPALWFGLRSINRKLLVKRLRPLWCVGTAFLLFYVAARMVAFTLFLPDRYVQYPLNLLYALLLGVALAGAWSRWVRPRGRAATAALILLAALAGGARLHNVALYDYSALAGTYAAVEAATPKQAMIAGHPELMDNVMTFSRRNALATFELSHVWSRGLWDQLQPRLEGFFTAYYSQDPADVAAFAKTWKVDFILVDPEHFSAHFLAGSPYFQPFGAAIKDMTRGRTRFALLDEAAFPRIPAGGGRFLVDVRAQHAAP
ncbi:hypothetical protein [Fundidesulfovibrio soli]|uniref:hypothetical protein n=1 Tax=Fundidesulfovibrio soli TaxID=2922716 RepID=UPI001FAFB3FB|nr:hypothetical protein [Fundidesulfovibrio soli]